MVTNRAYSPGLLTSTDRRASLFYFTAAVPAVGFVHGAADLYPRNAATFGSYAEGGFMRHGWRIDSVTCREGSATSRQP
jgi:hypothetical protein